MRIRTATDLGLVIRDRRRKLGLDQRALADRVGVSRQWIIAIEKGKPRAEVGLLLQTLNALDLRLEVEAEQKTLRGDAAWFADIDAVIDRARGKRR